jgi:hypothetical protein
MQRQIVPSNVRTRAFGAMGYPPVFGAGRMKQARLNSA